MKIAKKELTQNEVELTITVPYEDVQEDLKEAARQLSKRMNIPGFRPGKVPLDVMKKKVGEQHILETALERIVQRTFVKAIVGEGIETVEQPKIDVQTLAPGNPISYKATVAILPEVQLGDYTRLNVERKEVVVDDAQVEKVLQDLRTMRAKETLADRAAKEGDKVEVDFSISIDKVPIDGGQSKNHPLTIGAKHFIPGFEEGLVGMRRGEEKTYPVEFPKTYHEKRLAGKTAEVKVKMQAVYDVAIPELNEDFAKSLGNFQTIDDVKKQIRENLIREEEQREQGRYEMALVDAVRKKSTIGELPKILIDREKEKMLRELEQSISKQGMEFDKYLTSIGKTRDDLKNEFTADAEKRVSVALILRAISRAEKVTVELDELEKEKNAYLQNMPDSPELREQVQSPAFDEYLTTVIGNRKVFDILKTYAKETSAKEGAEAATGKTD